MCTFGPARIAASPFTAAALATAAFAAALAAAADADAATWLATVFAVATHGPAAHAVHVQVSHNGVRQRLRCRSKPVEPLQRLRAHGHADARTF